MVGRSDLTRCVLGVRSIVGDGCRFENVVMMGADKYESAQGETPIGVGEHSVVTDAIIDKNARIGAKVRLSPEGLEDGWVRVSEEAPEHHPDNRALYVRDGVLVVQKNATVRDGIEVGKN
tara:strand:- start:216 stop:575 length:360 start_codon:yes stop_codon:yes gene_type:complete